MPDIDPFRTDADATVNYETPSTGATGLDTPLLTKSVGDYQLQQLLGQGGMGAVYRALQKSTGRVVALKLIRADRVTDLPESERQAWLDRFRAEAQAAARLDHDNAVTMFEVGTVDGQPFYSMKYVAGDSLAERIRDRPADPIMAAGWIEQVARAVHHAHERGIVHRDIKPANILIDAAGRALVTDFGIAKLDNGSMTHTGQVLGTPQFMAPEQAVDSAHLTPACDVYGLGATLYAALTGRPPFQAASVAETVRQVLEVECVPPRAVNPAVPRDLEIICVKCLSKEPAGRYRTAGELADDLRRFLGGEPIVARPVGRLERTWKWIRRRPAAASLAAALVLGAALAAIASMQWTRARNAEADAVVRQTLKLADDAMLAAQRGQWTDALQLNDQAIQRGHPEAFALRLRKVRLLEANWDRPAAQKLIQQIALEPAPPQHEGLSCLLQGQYLLSQDDEQAIQLLSRALQLPLPEAEREFAQCLLAKTIPEALQHAERAVAFQPWHRGALIDASLWSAVLGHVDKGRDYSRRAVLLFPQDAELVGLNILFNYLAHRDLPKAKQELAALRDRMPPMSIATLEACLELFDLIKDPRRFMYSGNAPFADAIRLGVLMTKMTNATLTGSQSSQSLKTSPFDEVHVSPYLRRYLREWLPSLNPVAILSLNKTLNDKLDDMVAIWPCGVSRFMQLSRKDEVLENKNLPADLRDTRLRDLAKEALEICEMPSLLDVRRVVLDYGLSMIAQIVADKMPHECPDDYQLAIRIVRQRLQFGPIDQYDEPMVLNIGGVLLARAGDVALARNVADALDRLHPSNDAIRIILRAQIELASGQPANALNEARAGLKSFPNNRALIQLAEQATEQLELTKTGAAPMSPSDDVHRSIALKVLAARGQVSIVTAATTARTIRSLDALPKISFRLTAVGARGLPFDDELQRQIAQIDSLRIFAMSNSPITDSQLACLAQCKNLEMFSLVDARVTDAGLAHLKDMGNLKSLTLRQTAVNGSGLEHITSKNLTELVLDGAATDLVLAHLDRMDNVFSLFLRGPDLTDRVLQTVSRHQRSQVMISAPLTDHALELMGRYETIKMLALDDTKITDAGLAILAKNCPMLVYLQLGAAPITDAGLPNLAPLAESLTQLNIWKTNITDAGLPALVPLRNLASLSLATTGVTDAGMESIAKLPRLETLSLMSTRITDAGLPPLADLPRLTSLDLRQTAVTKAGVDALQAKLPKCKIVFDQK